MWKPVHHVPSLLLAPKAKCYDLLRCPNCLMADAEYDVFLLEAFFWPGALLGELLGIPTVDILSFAPLQPFFAKAIGIPNPVAYLP